MTSTMLFSSSRRWFWACHVFLLAFVATFTAVSLDSLFWHQLPSRDPTDTGLFTAFSALSVDALACALWIWFARNTVQLVDAYPDRLELGRHHELTVTKGEMLSMSHPALLRVPLIIVRYRFEGTMYGFWFLVRWKDLPRANEFMSRRSRGDA